MKSHIIHHDDDLGMASVDVKNLFEVFFEAFVITSLVEGNCHLSSAKVVAAHCGLSFPSSLFANHPGLATFFAPLITDSGRIGERKLIFEQQYGIQWTFKKFFLAPP